MKIGFVIPTKDRPDELLRTISSFESLDRSVLGDCPCIVVVDNASHDPVELACTTRNGIAIQQIRLERNAGASARNIGVSALDADWVVMLDDDSQLQQCDLAHVLDAIPSDVAAVGGEIFLPDGSREAGGLPEVVIGCGCVVRRDLFLEVGGYDAAFDYYVEEYDLCARLIQQGYKVIHTHSLRFLHRKVQTGRAFDRILHRLVRNNAWVIQRYAPHSCRDSAMKQMLRRYELIATKENVSSAFQLACDEIEETLSHQPSREMTPIQWDRLIGVEAVRQHLLPLLSDNNIIDVRVVTPGKGYEEVCELLRAHGYQITSKSSATSVIGTLSPGPLQDAYEASHGSSIKPWPCFESAVALDGSVV